MTGIDTDAVDGEDCADFLNDGGAGSFDTEGGKDRVNGVTSGSGMIDGIKGEGCQDTSEIDSFRCDCVALAVLLWRHQVGLLDQRNLANDDIPGDTFNDIEQQEVRGRSRVDQVEGRFGIELVAGGQKGQWANYRRRLRRLQVRPRHPRRM